MKNILKKGSKVFMVMLMTLSMMFSSSSIVKDANAATITYMEQRKTDWIQNKAITSKTGKYHSSLDYFLVMTTSTSSSAGEFLYCIEFGESLPDDTTMTSTTSATTLFKGTSVGGTTAAQKMDLVSRIAGRSNIPIDFEADYAMPALEKVKYLVGRTLIWEVTEGERDADFNLASSDGSWTHVKNMWTFSDYTSSAGTYYSAEYLKEYFNTIYDSWVSQIQYEIRIENDIPSFASTTKSSANTVELNYDSSTDTYSTTLTDSNSVITLYDNDIEYSSSALSSSRSGYKLTINSSSVISKDSPATITFNADRDIVKGSILGYVAGNYQKVISIGSPSSTSRTAYLKVYTEDLGSLKLAKKDNKGNYIADTTFKVSYNSDMSDPVGTYTTGSDGTVTVSDLYSGTVYIQETSVPDNLVLDSTVHSVIIKSGETSSYTATNDWKQGYIQVTKYDAKTSQVVKQSGVEFEILSGSTVVETITTNSNGIATSGLLDYGTYTIREKTNPENYIIVTTTESQSVTEDGKTYKVSIYNEPVVGSITITKEDSENGDAQGEATLEGATYVLKAKEDILNPATGTVLYTAGTTISTKTVGNSTWGDTGEKITDENGQITWSNLPMGTYVISETSASTGYTVSDKTYTVTLTPANNTSSKVVESLTVKEDIVKGYIQVTKKDSKTGEIVQKEGIEFEILSEDGSTVIETIKTDETGIALSSELLYGTYLVREKTNPENYTLATTTLTQAIREDGEIYSLTISNEPVVGSINLTKEDSENGEAQGAATLEGATYVLKAKEDILNPATGTVLYTAGTTISTKTVGSSTWGDTGEKTTDGNGQITWSNLPMGTYVISETSASTGYTVSDKTYTVTLTPTNNTSSKVVESLTVKEDIIKGYIQVTKKDAKTGEIVQKEGIEFEILSEDGSTVIETIKTSKTGIAISSELLYGTYLIREKTNPENYTLATATLTQAIKEDGKVYSLTISNEPVVGSIYLTKKDSGTGNVAQGDATLKGATYVLKAYEDILNPASGKVLFEKDETISIKTVGTSTWGDTGEKSTDSNAEISWTNLPMGTYVISEIKASEGYLVTSTTHVVTLTQESNTKNVTSKSITSKEDIIKGKIQIAKSGNDGSTGVIQGLANVEFTIKLYSDVQSVGWDEAETYDVLLTDETGRVTSVDLPYGVYLVKETYTPENYYAGGDFFVIIDENEEIEYRLVNNSPFKAWLKLVKSDEDGNEITLSNATFKLKDSNGNYIQQKSGWTYIDTWTTDEDGIVYLDNMVETGTYYIEEVTSPDGFLLADEIKVEIVSTNESITFDEDNDPIITVNIVDEKPTGTIILNKSTELFEDIINKGIKFQLKANSNIIDPTDGSVIYSKGDIVTKDYKDGIYEIDENGTIKITDLPLGTEGASYLLTEVETQDGYVLLEEPIQYDFTIENNTTKVYTVEKEAENELTETYFSKTDVGGNEIEGAQMVLTDNTTGTVIDEWTSTTEEHLVKGLIYDHEYTLSETTAPDGYAISTDITFIYSTEIEKVTMTDKQVTVTKVDTDGDTISGATLQIVDKETGEIVDTWTTTTASYEITDTMKEIISEDGVYAVAKSFIIQSGTTGSTETVVTLSNGVYRVEVNSKGYNAETDESYAYTRVYYVDEEGNALNYLASNLEVGKTYILQEIETPKGYVTASDVEFTVTEDENQDIVMTDKQVMITKEDIGGKEVEGAKIQVIDKDNNIVDEWISTTEAHAVTGLIEGETYNLHEEYAPDGYVIATDVEFTVSEEKVNQEITLTDKQVLITKEDVGGEEVEGAKIQVIDKDNNIVDEWVSTTEAHAISGLVEGETYTLHEEYAPDGYVIATDIEFTVSEEKVNQEITLTDKQVLITKEDVGGKEVEGATIQVIDKDNNVVDEWISTTEAHAVSGLVEGETYTLHEEYAPDGYVIATDIEFTVGEEKVNEEMTMIDKQVFVSKEDIAGEEVEGATIQVIDEDNNIVDEWISTNETHAISGLEEGKTYILHEEVAPNGYYVANDIEFTISNDKVNEYHTIIDEKILTDIQVIKTDSNTGNIIKNLDFMFTLYSDQECTQEIMSVHANSDDGTVIFEDLEYGTYYILETQAPKGYQLSDEVIKVVVDDDLENVGSLYSLEYENTPIPTVTVTTGDNAPVEALWWTTFIVGISGVYLSYKKKKYLEDKVD
ncbi:MAG: hypothetical protein LUG60_12010 [Erysipelotrichaceae bacterium]|nr:hypothetical protein [Erysipelotrichaceae bacterium]